MALSASNHATGLGSAFDGNPVLETHPSREEVTRKASSLAQVLDPEVLALLPDPELRPILLAAVLHELRELDTTGEVTQEALLAKSRILRVLKKPYEPFFAEDVLAVMGAEAGEGEANLEEHPTTNSTVRNMLLANRLNEFLAGSGWKAELALADYTWKGWAATHQKGQLPTLPEGTDEKPYLKVLIRFTKEKSFLLWVRSVLFRMKTSNDSPDFADYGVPASGEGIGEVLGTPAGVWFTADENGMKKALKAIARRQAKPADREAVARMEKNRELGRKLAADLETCGAWPKVISSVDNLSEPQIDAVLQWAEEVVKGGLGSKGVIYSGLQGQHALLQFGQPSTRTNAAAHIACRDVLGMGVDDQDLSKSSAAKGESPASTRMTLRTHHYDTVLTRTKEFEAEAEAWTADPVSPTRISLGGNEHHPTQTLSEVLTLMRHFGCEQMTLEELREKTHEKPPTISFIGHTKNKRADKALIRFILKYLPEWKVLNLVPEDKYLPEISGDKYKARVDENLRDQDHLIGLLKGEKVSIVYTCNAEKTSGEDGAGDGIKPVNYHASVRTLNETGCMLMHPLPASENAEIEDAVLTHPNSLITAQMKGKIAVIASLVAHQLAA